MAIVFSQPLDSIYFNTKTYFFEVHPQVTAAATATTAEELFHHHQPRSYQAHGSNIPFGFPLTPIWKGHPRDGCKYGKGGGTKGFREEGKRRLEGKEKEESQSKDLDVWPQGLLDLIWNPSLLPALCYEYSIRSNLSEHSICRSEGEAERDIGSPCMIGLGLVAVDKFFRHRRRRRRRRRRHLGGGPQKTRFLY